MYLDVANKNKILVMPVGIAFENAYMEKPKIQLHKHIVVDNAELKDGLLKVSYHRDIPEAEKPKQIKKRSS